MGWNSDYIYGWTLKILNLWVVLMYFGVTIALLELWVHKGLIHTVENVGGGIGHDPATEVTHLKLNQLPVFSSVYI